MDPTTYRAVEPTSDLRPYVRRLLVANDQGLADQAMRPAPTGYNYLAWVYDGELLVSIDERIASRHHGMLFFGQIQRHDVTIKCLGRVRHILAEFTATGLYRLAHTPGKHILGQMAGVEAVKPELDTRLNACVDASLNNAAEPLHAFEQALLDRVDDALPAIDYVQHAADAIESADGQVRVSELCKEIGISQRQLARTFTETVGIGPKFFSKVLHANTALAALLGNSATSLTELSQVCGYYDQAHFVHTMQEFFRQSPTELQDSTPVLLSEFLGSSRRVGHLAASARPVRGMSG